VHACFKGLSSSIFHPFILIILYYCQ
jgi:hypothetical protein